MLLRIKAWVCNKFQKLFDRRPSKSNKLELSTYLFSDIGVIRYMSINNKVAVSNILTDAGIGSTVTVKFGYYDIQPLTIRFDVPFYISDSPTDNFDLRFVMGIDRAF